MAWGAAAGGNSWACLPACLPASRLPVCCCHRRRSWNYADQCKNYTDRVNYRDWCAAAFCCSCLAAFPQLGGVNGQRAGAAWLLNPLALLFGSRPSSPPLLFPLARPQG